MDPPAKGNNMELMGVLLLTVVAYPIYRTCVEWRRLCDPQRWKYVGVIVRRVEALDSVMDVIGRYMGRDIHRLVVFHGFRYEFKGVAPQSYKRRMRGAELFLEPGLLYGIV